MSTPPTPPTAEEIGWKRVEPSEITGGDRVRVHEPNGTITEWTARSSDFPSPHAPEGTTYYIWPRPEPEPWESIPVGEDSAADLLVNGVPGRYFFDAGSDWVFGIDPDGGWTERCSARDVHTVTPLHVIRCDAEALARASWKRGDLAYEGAGVPWGRASATSKRLATERAQRIIDFLTGGDEG